MDHFHKRERQKPRSLQTMTQIPEVDPRTQTSYNNNKSNSNNTMRSDLAGARRAASVLAERDRLLVADDVLEVATRLGQAKTLKSHRGLVRVLEMNTQVRPTCLARCKG